MAHHGGHPVGRVPSPIVTDSAGRRRERERDSEREKQTKARLNPRSLVLHYSNSTLVNKTVLEACDGAMHKYM
jgi:hypothetical protein